MEISVQKQTDEEKAYEELIETKKINDVEAFNEKMESLIEKSKTFQLSILQKFTILFYSHYNHLTQNSIDNRTKKLIELSTYMVSNFKNEQIAYFTNEEIKDKFSENFKNFKIFSEKKKKDFYETCFSIIILSKNIKLMEIFFNDYLKIKVFDEEEYKSLSLSNPYTANLFDSLFNDTYEKIKANQRDQLEQIIKKCMEDSKFTIFNLFRCSECYDIMIATLNQKNNFDLNCPNCRIEKKNIESQIINIWMVNQYTQFKCAECGKEIVIYKENFKCTRCKRFICSNCTKSHLKKCFSLYFIKLYEVGYKCEIHNKNYIQYCYLCKKNLCKTCVEIHEHMIKKIFDLSAPIIIFVQNNKNKDSYSVLKKALSLAYLSQIKYKLFNGRINDILCSLYNTGVKYKKKDFLFKQFGNDEFQNYYSKLLENVNKGKKYYSKHLFIIKNCYKQNISPGAFPNYISFVERETNITVFIEETKAKLKEIQEIYNYIKYESKIYDLKKENEILKIKNIELMVSYNMEKYSRLIHQENTYKLLSRFLADKLMQLIIDKYSKKLNPISLNLNILVNLVGNDFVQILSDNRVLDSLSTISSDMLANINQLKINPKDEKIKSKIINLLNTSSGIKFIGDVIIDNETFNKDELNKILDILFFIKNKGNIIAHPNININESLKSIQIQKFPVKFGIENFYDSLFKDKIEDKIDKKVDGIKLEKNNMPDLSKKNEEDIYYNLTEFNLKFNLEYDLLSNINEYKECINNNIIEKISQIRNDFLSSFNPNKLNNEVRIDDIIEAIFEGKMELIFKETKDFLRVYIQETDEVIQKYSNLDLKKELTDEDKNIKLLINYLDCISSMINDYPLFEIPRHYNLEDYINILIDEEENNKAIDILKMLKSKLPKKDDYENGYLITEIEAEACFLLLVKTYIKETKKINTIIKSFEKEVITNIIYQEIRIKLNEIYKIFEKKLEYDYHKNLIESIKNKFFQRKDNNDFNLERTKYVLTKLLLGTISFEETKESKLDKESKLFLKQNS